MRPSKEAVKGREVFFDVLQPVQNSRDGVFLKVLEGEKNNNAYLPVNSNDEEEFFRQIQGKKVFYTKQVINFPKTAYVENNNVQLEFIRLKSKSYDIIQVLSRNQIDVDTMRTRTPAKYEQEHPIQTIDGEEQYVHFGDRDCSWVARKVGTNLGEKGDPLLFKMKVLFRNLDLPYFLGVESEGSFGKRGVLDRRKSHYFCQINAIQNPRELFTKYDGIGVDSIGVFVPINLAGKWEPVDKSRDS